MTVTLTPVALDRVRRFIQQTPGTLDYVLASPVLAVPAGAFY